MCKIIEIKDRGVEIRTPRELLDEIPDIDELICAEGYTRLDMDSCLCQIDVKKTLNNAGIKFEETFMGYVVTANSCDVELALKLNKLVHDECKDVPHDIGLRIVELIERKPAITSFCNCKGGAKGRTVTADFEQQICEQCGKIAK